MNFGWIFVLRPGWHTSYWMLLIRRWLYRFNSLFTFFFVFAIQIWIRRWIDQKEKRRKKENWLVSIYVCERERGWRRWLKWSTFATTGSNISMTNTMIKLNNLIFTSYSHNALPNAHEQNRKTNLFNFILFAPV